MVRVARAPAGTPHLVGPARTIGTMSTARRRAAVAALFGAAIVTILVCAEPFAESLVDTGRKFAIDDFVLISLIAPLASEAPELLIAGMFAWRLDADAGLGALVSSKVNQWTLLVGTLPIVFAISSGGLHGLPDRRGAARGAVRYRGAVGVRGRGAREPADQRAGSRHPARRVARAARHQAPAVRSRSTTEARISIGVLYLVMAAGDRVASARPASVRSCTTGWSCRSPRWWRDRSRRPSTAASD